MRRFVVPGGISLVVMALLAVLAFGVAQSGPSNVLTAEVHRGETPLAPNYGVRLQLLGSARRESLSELRGRVVMVNVFAGWCDTCQAEAGLLKQAEQRLSRHGGEVVGVTYQDSSSDAAGYMRRYGLSYPVLLDPGDTFVQPYGVNGVPETFIIGRSGHVVAADDGPMTSSWVKRTLNRVLGVQA